MTGPDGDPIGDSLRDGSDGRPGRRVAITGFGVVAPCGIGKDAFWKGLLGPGLTDRKVSTVENWDPSPWYDSPKEARRADRVEQFAVAAAAEAFEQAGDIGVDPERFGTIFASGIGGLQTLEDQVQIRLEKGDRTGVAVPHPDADGQRVGRADLDALRPAGPERDRRHRVRGVHARDRLRGAPHRVGSLRRDGHRRVGGVHHAHRRSPASRT